ncbi:acyl-CoA dehydrogenase family protein [Kamptonema cortianum]|nr:acyl-CoA dehydrogenase family protein [Geitlerinema splendidum]MDK3156955.1 acyl-CoA dehydrogenase family protein [Kamptonema cortianum]
MSAIILEMAEMYLAREVAPKANDIDQSESALADALEGLKKRKLMALRRPQEFGGPGLNELDFRCYQESVARYSGSLAFLQTQHQSAVSMISKGDNEELKKAYLPSMADERLVGIGFSQLRRPGEPMLKATEDKNGFRLTGTVPWVTGHEFFGEFLIGATLPSGEAVFGVVPFVDTEDNGGAITFDGPMRLAAMETPRTMSATATNWYLSKDLTAFIKPGGWIQSNDMINVTLQAWFALGCARAGLDILYRAYQKREASFLLEAWSHLSDELERCRERAMDQSLPEYDRLLARAWAIDLAARCAHAGVASSSGAANSIHHDAQRVYREAMVYTVSAQTQRIMEATLDRLVQRGTRPHPQLEK